MEEFRPSFLCSGGDRRMEIVSGKGFTTGNQIYTGPRSPNPQIPPRPSQVSSSSSSKPWGFSDPEMKRRKRVAKYKVYTVEGRVKASFKNGIRWFKNKCSQIIHGF
ncbi:hypothetical protein LguiA_011333 [Lonicera macranthoides]